MLGPLLLGSLPGAPGGRRGLAQRGHYRGPFDPTLLAGSMGSDSKHWQALGEVEANTWNRWDHLQASSLVGTVPNKLIVAKVSICIYMDNVHWTCLEPTWRGWSLSGCFPGSWSPVAL